MSILCSVFDKPLSDNLIKSLGNMIISGVSDEGSEKLYKELIIDKLKSKENFILLNGSFTKAEYDELIKTVRPYMMGRFAYDFRYGEGADSFDALSVFSTIDEKADFLVDVLGIASELSESIKSRAKRFFYYAMHTMTLSGMTYNLNSLLKLDIDKLIEMVDLSDIEEFEKNRRLRFLRDSSMYACFLDIETSIINIESSGICELLSGTESFEDILKNGNILLLTGFVSEDFSKKELLFNIMMYVLNKGMERCLKERTMSFMIKDADFIAGDYIKNIFEYNNFFDCAAYLFVNDITRYIQKNGNDLLDKTKSFLVFNQGSDENAAFWSAFFGSRDVQERSVSYTKKKSWNPFADIWDGGGVVETPRKYNSATQSFQKVNKPIYRPEVFRELRPSEVMCYLREPLMRRRTRIDAGEY